MELCKIEKAKSLFEDLESTERTLKSLNDTLERVNDNDGDWLNTISQYSDGSGWNVILNGVVNASDMIAFALNKADQRKRIIEATIEKM